MECVIKSNQTDINAIELADGVHIIDTLYPANSHSYEP